MVAFLTAVVVAAVTALLGMLSYLNQKRTDRQIELRKQQRTAYELYMQSYYDWTFTTYGTAEDREARTKYEQAYFKLFPLASDRFLRAAMAFHDFAWNGDPDYDNNEEDREKFEELWTSLVQVLREDAHIESSLTRKEIEDHIPWYWGDDSAKTTKDSVTAPSERLDEKRS
jgi:type II secretory pathway pseudopilin PulG